MLDGEGYGDELSVGLAGIARDRMLKRRSPQNEKEKKANESSCLNSLE
jgi:hypothetical protein